MKFVAHLREKWWLIRKRYDPLGKGGGSFRGKCRGSDEGEVVAHKEKWWLRRDKWWLIAKRWRLVREKWWLIRKWLIFSA